MFYYLKILLRLSEPLVPTPILRTPGLDSHKHTVVNVPDFSHEEAHFFSTFFQL